MFFYFLLEKVGFDVTYDRNPWWTHDLPMTTHDLTYDTLGFGEETLGLSETLGFFKPVI